MRGGWAVFYGNSGGCTPTPSRGSTSLADVCRQALPGCPIPAGRHQLPQGISTYLLGGGGGVTEPQQLEEIFGTSDTNSGKDLTLQEFLESLSRSQVNQLRSKVTAKTAYKAPPITAAARKK